MAAVCLAKTNDEGRNYFRIRCHYAKYHVQRQSNAATGPATASDISGCRFIGTAVCGLLQLTLSAFFALLHFNERVDLRIHIHAPRRVVTCTLHSDYTFADYLDVQALCTE